MEAEAAWRASAIWPSGWDESIPRIKPACARDRRNASPSTGWGCHPFQRFLATTNIIENPDAGVRIGTRRLTNWQNGSIARRRIASTLDPTSVTLRCAASSPLGPRRNPPDFSTTADCRKLTELLLRQLHEPDRSRPRAANHEQNQANWSWVWRAAQKTRIHARAERVSGSSMAAAAWAVDPLRTDSVSRGRSISLFTRDTILLSISIWLSFFIK
jgi:hypothetical protein